MVLNNERQIKMMQPLFSAADPENANKLLRQYRGLIFPEHKYDTLSYIKKARDMFDKLRDVNFYVKPLRGGKKK
jgi:hypothetical protein